MDLKQQALEFIEALFGRLSHIELSIKDLQNRTIKLESSQLAVSAKESATEVVREESAEDPVRGVDSPTPLVKPQVSISYGKFKNQKQLRNAIVVVKALLADSKVGKSLNTLSDIVGTKRGATQNLLSSVTSLLPFVEPSANGRSKRFRIHKSKIQEAQEWVSSYSKSVSPSEEDKGSIPSDILSIQTPSVSKSESKSKKCNPGPGHPTATLQEVGVNSWACIYSDGRKSKKSTRMRYLRQRAWSMGYNVEILPPNIPEVLQVHRGSHRARATQTSVR